MAERIAVDLEVNDKTADGIRSAISNADHLRISFEQAGDSMDRFESSLATTRHALYDLSSAYGRAGAATTAVLAATVGASAQFESAFTGVERTAGLSEEKLQDLHGDLQQLSRDIPEAFSGLSDIATTGGQLGVAGSELDSFTESVAMFAATTEATADAAAVGFGRIEQLTHAAPGSFQAIGSALYEVGNAGAATVPEVMNVAKEIATTADLSGFTTDQVIGLAGALSSLGVQPYRARGSMQRVFAELSDAVNNGGDSLSAFATISGRSAEQFVSDWRAAPAQVFQDLVAGLGQIEGSRLQEVLGSMGIKASTDITTMSQLANNASFVAEQFDLAATSYSEATALGESYALVADNLASKLATLGNSVAIIFSELGKSSLLVVAVDQLQNVTDAIGNILGWLNSLGGGANIFGTISTMVLAGAAAFTIYNAGMLALRATYLAMLQAQTALANSNVNVNASVREMVRTLVSANGVVQSGTISLGANAAAARNAATAYQFLGTSTSTTAAGMSTIAGSTQRLVTVQSAVATATRTNASAMANQAQQAILAGNAMAGYERATGFAARGAQLLSTAASALGPALLVGGAFTAASYAIEKIGQLFESDAQKVERYGVSWSGLSAALQQDTQTFLNTGQATEVFMTTTDGASQKLGDMTGALGEGSLAQAQFRDEIVATTTEMNGQIVAMGSATAAYVAQQITGNQEITRIFTENREALAAAGLSAQDFATKLNEVGASGTVEWMDELTQKLYSLKDAEEAYAPSAGVAASEGTARWEEYTRQIEAVEQATGVLSPVLNDLGAQLDMNAAFADAFGVGAENAANAVDYLGTESSNAAQDLLNLAESLLQGQMFSADFEGSMYALGQSLAVNGAEFSVFSENGRANMEALSRVVNAAAQQAAGDEAAFAASLKQILADLMGHGVNVANVFPQLMKQARVTNVNQLSNVMRNQSLATGFATKQNELYKKSLEQQQRSANRAATAQRKLAKDTQKAAKATAKAAEEAKYSVADYAKDLASIMSRSFEIRFDVQSSSDDTAGRWEKLADGFEDARDKAKDLRQQIRELQADLNGLLADRSTMEYQLNVAVMYGDTLRADELRAALGKNQEEINKNKSDSADKSKELSKAEAEATVSLQGNTDAARSQRKEILSLVQSYQAQIDAAAKAGATQQQLRDLTQRLTNEFYAQGSRMGYNVGELGKYGEALRNTTTIINNVPRSVNVSFNANAPEMSAINEWVANNTKGKGVSAPIDVPVTPSVGDIDPIEVPAGVDDIGLMDSLMDAVNQGKMYLYGEEMLAYLKANPIEGLHEVLWKGQKYVMDNYVEVPSKATAITGLEIEMATGQAKVQKGGGLWVPLKTGNIDVTTLNNDRSRLQTFLNNNPLTQFVDLVTRGRPRSPGPYADGYQFSSGGYTGPGGKYEPAGIVHKNEWVATSEQTNPSTGLPYPAVLASLLARQGVPVQPQANNVNMPSTIVVELSPIDRNLLAKAGHTGPIVIDGNAIAGAVSKSNTNSTTRGS